MLPITTTFATELPSNGQSEGKILKDEKRYNERKRGSKLSEHDKGVTLQANQYAPYSILQANDTSWV